MKWIICIFVIIISFLAITVFSGPIILFLAKGQIKNVFVDSEVIHIGRAGLNLPYQFIFLADLEVKRRPIYDFRIKEIRIYYTLNSIFKRVIPKIYIKEGSLNIKGFHLKGVSLKIEEETSGGLYIKEAGFYKVKLEDIKSNVIFKDRILSLDSLSGYSFGGRFHGDLNLVLNKDIEYTLNLNALNLDLETFVKDFNITEKFQMNGRLGGVLSLRGSGRNINFLKGNFSASEPGGRLTIKDKRFLKTIAKNTKQSLDILVKGFEDYHYTTGSIRLSLDGDSLILDIALDGETGKRNLVITVHNFQTGSGRIY